MLPFILNQAQQWHEDYWVRHNEQFKAERSQFISQYNMDHNLGKRPRDRSLAIDLRVRLNIWLTSAFARK